MNDVSLVLVAVVLLTFLPFDWYVYAAFRRESKLGTPIPALSLTTKLLGGIAVAASIGAFLAVHTIVFQRTGFRIVPAGVSVLLIVAAMVVISLPVIPIYRQLRRWRSAGRRFRIHQRDGERHVTPHRRETDEPRGGQP